MSVTGLNVSKRNISEKYEVMRTFIREEINTEGKDKKIQEESEKDWGWIFKGRIFFLGRNRETKWSD